MGDVLAFGLLTSCNDNFRSGYQPDNDNAANINQDNLLKYHIKRGESDDEIIRKLELGKITDQKNASLYNELGLLYSNKLEYSKAVENFKKVIELQPHNFELYNLLGTCYMQMNDGVNAMKYLEMAYGICRSNENNNCGDIIQNIRLPIWQQMSLGMLITTLKKQSNMRDWV